MIGIIYKLRNKVTGKCYVGLTTTSLEIRWRRHINKAVSGSKTYIHNAIRKYGKNNFEISVIKRSYVKNINTLKSMEIKYIKKEQCKYPNGYNLTDGGDGNHGWKPSKEFCKKMKLVHTGVKRKPFTEEHRRNIGNASRNRIVSKKTREKISRATKGKNNPRYGVVQTQQTKDRISSAFELRLKPIKFINPAGKIIEISNLRKFCRENGIFYESLHKVKSKVRKSHKGWRLYDPKLL